METYRVTVSEEYLSEFVVEARCKMEATNIVTAWNVGAVMRCFPTWKESVSDEMRDAWQDSDFRQNNGKLVGTEIIKQEVHYVAVVDLDNLDKGESPNEDRT